MSRCSCPSCSALPDHPFVPGLHVNPETRIPPIHEWGAECSRGWVSDARFARGAKDSVIPRANRTKTKQVYAANNREMAL